MEKNLQHDLETKEDIITITPKKFKFKPKNEHSYTQLKQAVSKTKQCKEAKMEIRIATINTNTTHPPNPKPTIRAGSAPTSISSPKFLWFRRL